MKIKRHTDRIPSNLGQYTLKRGYAQITRPAKSPVFQIMNDRGMKTSGWKKRDCVSVGRTDTIAYTSVNSAVVACLNFENLPECILGRSL